MFYVYIYKLLGKRNEELESTILERNSLTMLPQQTKQGILYIQYTCTTYVIIII